MKLLILGDQTLNVQPYLKDLHRHRGSNPLLDDFLVRSYHAIRTEIEELPQNVRGQFERLTCVEDILFAKGGSRQGIAMEMAATCMYQLGIFIRQHSDYLSSDTVCSMGVCTGTLTAAAISCSESVLKLIPNAVDAVIAAFRIGLCVTDMSRRLETQQQNRSWLLHVPTVVGVQEALQSFCDRSQMPSLRKPYISANAFTSISISGTPSTLQQLSESVQFKDFRPQIAPIYGPYHAPQLYSSDDVDKIVNGLGKQEVKEGANTSFFVTGDGTKVKGVNLNEALKSAVTSILLQPMSWPDSLDTVLAHFKSIKASTLSLTAIGTSSDQFLYKMLRQTQLGDFLETSEATDNAIEGDANGVPRDIRSKLAIVGMSGRYPGAENNDEYWDLLFAGLDVHKPVPPTHWDAATHVDPTGKRKNTSATPYGCWLEHPELFDALFFNISPREAPQIDPAQRLALMTAYEALEQAGIVPDATRSTRRDRVGVFFGTTANDWMETNSAQNIDTYFIPGGNRAFIPGRINYHFQFSGPSYAVDTACSSSLASIHVACNALWRGEIDTAIAGGSNVLTNPDFTAGLDRGHFLSRTGNCKTFDDSADGYCRGEGVATIILKRLEDAIADKDPILGTILSASTNHSAESVSITRPHVGAQLEVMRNILNRGGTQASEIGYVEMHGTGTQHGDASEMSSVLDTMAPSPKTVKAMRTRPADRPLYLGSAKANIGHGEAASGVCSVIKVLLMMKRNMIVPHCGIKTKINSKFPTDFEERNAHIALKPTAWNKSASNKSRKVVVNNFSAAGGNTALLIEDAPVTVTRAELAPDNRSCHLVAVSAKGKASLEGNLRNLIKYLEKNPDVDLGKLSYTTTARRIHYQFRVMASAANAKEVKDQLQASLESVINITRPKSGPKLFFAFTGQGAHFAGMGRELFNDFSLFSSEFKRLNRLGQSMGFASALPALECTDEDGFSSLGPVAIQLAGIYIQMVLCKLWASWGIAPEAVVGHSLGEYPAMAAAGILSDADAIYLVGRRAQLVADNCEWGTHSMLVIRGSADEIRHKLDEQGKSYEVSCINSPVETVLSGLNEDLLALKDILSAQKFQCTMLKVPYAFHSAQMDPILEPFEDVIRGVSFSKPTLPYLSAADGKWLDSAESFDPSYLIRHTRDAVHMQQALKTAADDGSINDQSVVVEIGPHPAILPMFKANVGSHLTCLPSASRQKSSSKVIAETLKALYLKNANIHWPQYHHDFTASHEVLALPAYSWDLKPFWMQYVNDWSLRKGDPPLMVSNTPSLESTTIHNIVSESLDGPKASIVVEANIARKDLSPLVQGHEVDGIPLCTPSVYGDIALTLGRYLVQRYRPDHKQNFVDVSDMTIAKALILRDGATEQILRAYADVDWDINAVNLAFKSFDTRGKLQEHAKCVVRFHDRSKLQALEPLALETQQKIKALRDGIVSADSARFNRPMVYRAIRPLARFHEDYRAIDEVVLNSNTLEAACRLSFGTVKRGGTYHTHPAVIDALTQSCGFTMNCNDATDLDQEVFMNHGWGSFHIFEPIDMDKSYVTYTQMFQGEDQLWRGDVVILHEDRVVAFFGKIAIQRVPRRVLKTILSIEAGNKTRQQPSQAQKKAEQQKPAVKPTPVSRDAQLSDDEGSPMQPGTPHEGEGLDHKALLIIADEGGLALSDLEEDTIFADVGIDSLLSLTISARIKDELDLDFDPSAMMTEFPSVSQLRGHLGGSSSNTGSKRGSLDSTASDDSKHSPKQSFESSKARNHSSAGTDSGESSANFERAVEIIAEESGIAPDELVDSTEFADVGVDSLLSLIITSRLRDELDIDLPQDALFNECGSMGDVRRKLSVVEPTPALTPASSGQSEAGDDEEQPPPPTKSQQEPESKCREDVPYLEKADEPNLAGSKKDAELNLATRKQAVDNYVSKYTKDFGTIGLRDLATEAHAVEDAKVVMVTGASGSLGSHLVHQLAPREDVKMVVCLNRVKKNTDPYERQAKAMRDKGLRNFEELHPKLLVLQTDTSEPLLGLSEEQYRKLVSSVTHLIHNAWPMSAKRGLEGFESQFQVMRNLADFAHNVSVRRPAPFRFSFTQVSSIGVVGYHNLADVERIGHVEVPEDRVTIDSVLPNGYSEAKWGIERMLDETLHKHDGNRFRAMVARLGQIAGSRTHFYWPPTEHFAFLVKSSKTLNTLPDVSGKLFWTPVEDVAGSLIDLNLADNDPYPVYHIDSPVGQKWADMNKILADELGITGQLSFKDWLQNVRKAPARDNPAQTLADFFEDTYLRMSCGGLTLDVKHTLEHSPTLNTVGPVSEEIVRKYILVWREIGFLKKEA